MAGESRQETLLLRQQTALAKFGEFAFTSDDIDAILHEACRLVREGLRTDLAKIVELQPDGITLLVRAGVGWEPGIVGHATSRATPDTFEGAALATHEPVRCTDLSHESADKVAGFVRKHGVRAFVNVNILGPAGEPSYGLLEVDCREPRAFSGDDVAFLRTYANLLAAVVQRSRSNAELVRRAAETRNLLNELQHRIKNNLQILMSLINFQMRTADAAAQAELRKVGQRVRALGLVHERLHRVGQVDRIELGAYLADIADALLRLQETGAGTVHLSVRAARIDVPPELAITLGLVTNEFVTNSLKYAFGETGGTIGIALDLAPEGLIRLQLSDDGKGLPAAAMRGSGMALIEALSRPIANSVEWGNHGGTRLAIVVPQPARR